jgi:hypothetical protein
VSTHDTLRLIWQNPVTRQFLEVGRLTDLGQGRYGFEYSQDARDQGFFPLAEFPDLDKAYTSDQLPAFFANRVMTTRRENYADYLSWLGLGDVPTPMEVLARTGGGRATDTFHVVSEFREHNGKRQCEFFASGISHIPSAERNLASLQPGDVLEMRDEPDNPVNPRAILLDARAGREVGWVPDWLVGEVHRLRQPGWTVTVQAAHINLAAPPHMRLLCQLQAHR